DIIYTTNMFAKTSTAYATIICVCRSLILLNNSSFYVKTKSCRVGKRSKVCGNNCGQLFY
ncbi:MAG: hypothetical protein ACI86M_003104, partial [Saprospiraceae bacterium]